MKSSKIYILVISLFMISLSFSQEEQKELKDEVNGYVHQANELLESDDFVDAEVVYRKAISKDPASISGAYNLGNAYYKKGNFEESLYRYQQATISAKTKEEKHKAFHNLGNALMKVKKCKLSVEAYKNALRNDPSDEETRYNLAMAMECAKQQQENQDNDKEDKQEKNKQNEEKEENKDKDKEKEGDKEEKENEEGNQEKEDNKDKKDEKDQSKQQQGKEDDKKPNKPQEGKLSPQQIKNLLEAMSNQEEKVQEKMNAEKQKGIIIQTEKDW